ncbi:LrgB family protein [Alteromonas facilis]|uniref:LrgB family protein n=1 Tax=Alteromonas facilis TaxID=2048004 RepID=UPI000C28A426|nr:LrgB family protein [Alteromonas facilis]
MLVQTFQWGLITLISYGVALLLFRRCHKNPLAHPIITTVVLVAIVLALLKVNVETYQSAVAFLHWLLGPATVALAIPLFRQVQVIRNFGWRVIVPILLGGIVAPLLAWLSVLLFSDSLSLQMTMLAKSITTPLAMDVAGAIGGIPGMAAVIVITTGIVGAIASSWLFRVMKVNNPIAQGIALGTVAHAVGTSRALQMNETTAALASLSLCLNGIFTALVLPIMFGS